MQIKSAIGVAQRSSAQRALFPLHFPSSEFDAEHRLSRRAVEVITNLYRATYCGRQFRFKINLLGLETAFLRFDPHQSATGSRRANINGIATHNRCGNVCAIPAYRLRVTPEEFAAGCVHADQSLLQELNVLFRAANLERQSRGVCRRVTARHGGFPNDFTSSLVEGDNRRVAPTRRADQSVPINQRRFRISPFARLPDEVRAKTLLPLNLASGGVQTCQ